MRRVWIGLLVVFVAAGCSQAPPPEEPKEPAAEEAVEPDIRGEEVSYTSGDVTLKGYLAYDAAKEGTRPGILIVHEWWGHNDYVRMRARMLAEMGYTALALDMYGDGKNAGHPEDAQKFMMEVIGNMPTGEARFMAAKEVLENHKTTGNQIAAIGYCFGGAVVLHMARIGTDLRGVASFHGDLSTQSPAQPDTVKARVLVLHGAADPFVPADTVEAFKKEMADADVNMRFVAYADTVHSFTNPGATAVGEQFNLPLRYDEEADKQSWAELHSFLNMIFGH